MAKEKAAVATGEAAPADEITGDPGSLAQAPDADPTGDAQALADAATAASLRAHDLTPDSARGLLDTLREAVARAERVVAQHAAAGQ